MVKGRLWPKPAIDDAITRTALIHFWTGNLAVIFCPGCGSYKITYQPLGVDHRDVPNIIVRGDFDEIHAEYSSFIDQTMNELPRLNPI